MHDLSDGKEAQSENILYKASCPGLGFHKLQTHETPKLRRKLSPAGRRRHSMSAPHSSPAGACSDCAFGRVSISGMVEVSLGK